MTKPSPLQSSAARAGFVGAIGDTPLIALPKLSAALGRTILGKAEYLNPGGSVKDRAARGIVEDFEARGLLAPGGTVVEGTAGNTGIGLTLVGNARGYRTVIVMPDDQAAEKYALLRTYGAELHVVESVALRRTRRTTTTPRAGWPSRSRARSGPTSSRTPPTATRTSARPGPRSSPRPAAS